MKRLQNLSYKTLLTIFIFSLAGIVFFLKIGGKTTKVSAAWWDDMWHYRKAISIDNSSGSDLTDFQVALSIGTSQLIADGKMQNNCNDIRITDINGNLLPYWIETTGTNKCNQTADTRIWIKANSLPTSGSTVYIYYGNPSADNQSSGQNTFIYFKDNFQTSDVDWNWSNGGVENGWAKTWANGNDSPGSTMVWLKNIIDITNQEVVVEFTVKSTKSGTLGHTTTNVLFNPIRNTTLYNNTSSSTIANGNGNSIITFGDYTNWYGKVGFDSSTGQASNIANSTSYPLYQFNTDGWVRHVHKLTSSGLLLSGYSLGGLDTNSNPWLYTEKTVTSGYTKPNSIILAIGEQYNETTWMSEAFVRKYASTQPTTSNQSEETGGGPIAYWKFDEGSGTTAYNSAGTNNGTLSGSTLPEWQTEENCVSGKCLNFTSSNYNYIDTTDILNFTNVTFSFWIKVSSSFPAGSRIGNIIGNYSSTNNINIEGYTNGKIRVYWNAGQINLVGNQDIRDDKWHYISVVRNNSTNKITIYIDSKVDAETTAGSDISMSKAFRIGGDYRNGDPPNNPGIPLTAVLDEVKIYPYARTADQIKQDYNSRGTLSGAGVNLGVKSNTGPSLKSSLIAYYKFDEGIGTTVYDSSPQKNLGYFVGTTLPTWSNNCKAGKCINFISTNSNNISTNVNYNNGSEYTISAYIYPTSISGTRVVLGTAMGNNIDAGLVVSGTSNICYHNYSGSGDTNYCSTNSPIILNTWQHVALSMKNNDINIYHNGVNVRNVSVGRTATTNFAIIGGASVDAYSGARYFNGSIDEVKIYNKALTADEIKQDYNANSAIQFGSTNQTIGGTTTSLDYCIPGDTSYCVPPVAEYNFEENTGTTAKDTSGGNNNGNFSSGSYAPTWSTGKNNTGSGIKFNGESNSSYINTSFPSTPPSSYTAEAWIKPFSTSSSLNPTLGYSILAASYDSTHYPLWITLRDGEITATSFSNAITPVSTLGANIQTNRWYHIAVSAVQNGPAIIYVNGIGKTSFTSSNIAWNSNDKLTIGELRPTRNISFNGIIDQVKIYDYARTPAQIAYDYNKGGPVGWWKLDECQGSTAFDASGLGNTGAISIGLSGSQTSLGTCQTGTSAAWTNGSSGHTNGSLNFDGTDDYMLIPYSPAWKNKDFTTSFWINPRAYTDIETGYGSHWFYSPEGFGIVGSNTVWINNSSGRQSFSGCNFNNLNKWSHLTLSYNQDTGIGKLYVNSKLNCSINLGPGTAIPWNTSNGIYVGGTNSGSYNGPALIDDIKIFPYTLTDEQVKQVYNGGAVNFQ